ncbi:type II toxin-antitoxin system HicB family antitoxin [Nostoc sp.]|uniref:type II toxin-antitoxin system HicB family antitoxin n=1 Tax=Nostoc sp. TaxID=1180 RepID=UPI003FA559D7
MKFNVILDRDEDGVWIVECPSIPGCVSQNRQQKKPSKISKTRSQAVLKFVQNLVYRSLLRLIK